MSVIDDDHDATGPKEDRSVELTCRLCLKECYNLQYRAIFQFDGDRAVSDWIEELTALKVNSNRSHLVRTKNKAFSDCPNPRYSVLIVS